eukprot:CAMPEP_0171338884 /NCGR_PEP_ID=MMETSP0878-20121228/7600_1 /TAXON_ID=67004 /ORGANISM="Thalassiosira weissflogii, Strain CCMP1336" /LENGTH=244 /DNA_ID=CAMNT_0011840713 /DNA_START=98 /DNA_END=832 /DNA_ORIENTATION=+
MTTPILHLLISLLLIAPTCLCWQVDLQQPLKASATLTSPSRSPRPPIIPSQPSSSLSRRSLLLQSPLLLLLSLSPPPPTNAATPNLTFTTTPSGLQYADVKLGSSSPPTPPTPGQTISIDYVMSTTGARYGTKIYSTLDAGAPYRWNYGDGSTIPGLEEAVATMSPGGIRRVIIPETLGYRAKNKSSSDRMGIVEECVEGRGLGPIPPSKEALGEFQRFKNIYCNPDRMYQPDLVMDVKLYGKR